MKDITKFVSKKTKEEHLIQRFIDLVQSAESKEDIRQLEEKLLRPKPIRRFNVPSKSTGFNQFKQRSIRITFPKKAFIKIWQKFFRVNSYLEYNSYDVEFIQELLHLLDNGRLEWDKKKQKYYVNMKSGRRLKL